jgi:type I restriction enzyme M protein
MPSNIFATTGTNVSIIFIDKTNKTGKAVLVDASSLGTKIKDGKNQKTLLSKDEEQHIIDTVNGAIADNGFSAVKTFDEIKDHGGYSFNPGTYFDVQIQYVPISPDDFDSQMRGFDKRLAEMFSTSAELERAIRAGVGGLRLEQD